MYKDTIEDLNKKGIINFYIKREELLQALEFLSPFIDANRKYRTKEDEEALKYDRRCDLVFSNRVTFIFTERELCLFVCVDGVRIEKFCSVETGYNGLSFCIYYEDLMRCAQSKWQDTLLFVEDRFSGFVVYTPFMEYELFTIRASSTRLQPDCYSKDYDVIYPNAFLIERETLLDSLNIATHYSPVLCERDSAKGIYYNVDEGKWTVTLCNDLVFRQKKYYAKHSEDFAFRIPLQFAQDFGSVLSKWGGSAFESLCHNKTNCQFNHLNPNAKCRESIEFPLYAIQLEPVNVILGNTTICHKATIPGKDFLGILTILKAKSGKDDNVVLHCFHNRLNIYWQDRYHKESLFQFVDANNSGDSFSLLLNLDSLFVSIQDIASDSVNLCVTESGFVHLFGDNEAFMGDDIRIVTCLKMNDAAQQLVKRGEEDLNNHPVYKEKYLTSKPQPSAIINNLLDVIVLGEEFPNKEYIKPGDFTTAVLNESSFDVIISLTDITEQEERAIADEAFDIYIIDTESGPFMVFQFGKNLKFDFSLNILKMDQTKIPGWLQNPEETICIYVLEGSNSVVKAIRYVPFTKMYDLKVSCMRQMGKEKAEIDAFIQSVYARYSIPDLIRNASCHFTVPEVEASL